MKNATAIIAALSILAGAAHSRTWTSADGRSLEADLIAYDASAGTVRIKRADGKVFTLQTSKLSESDIAYLDGVEKEKKEALAKAKSQAGTTSSHASSGEHKVPYHVYIPKGYQGTAELPMLILFSPSGHGKSLLNKFKEAADEMQWILVGCDQLKNGMDAEQGEAIFTELLPEIEKTVVHDSETVYLGGFSGGGLRSFDYSAKFDRPWKGILSCGGWLGGPAMWERDYPEGLAVAIINGDDDKGANSWAERDAEVLEKGKCKVREFEFPGGHTVGPSNVLIEAMTWIEKEQRE